MKKCEVFSHVSTAYCCDLRNDIIEEKLYSPPANWKECIEIAETIGKFQLSIMLHKYTEGYPNTYTFTKALAESVVADLCTSKLPTLILRPTIVYSAHQGPIKGWIGNLNGPSGLFLGQYKGIVRSTLGKENAMMDLIPIDYLINTLIKATWIQPNLCPSKVSIYNCSSSNYFEITPGKLKDMGVKMLDIVPPNPIWHINFHMTKSRLYYFINTFFFHFLPSLVFDFILETIGKPAIFTKLQRIIYNSTMTLQYFNSRSWIFKNNNCQKLDSYLKETDMNSFYISLLDIDTFEYIINTSMYIFNHILKEDIQPRNKVKRKLLCYIHNILKYVSILLIARCMSNEVVSHMSTMQQYLNDL